MYQLITAYMGMCHIVPDRERVAHIRSTIHPQPWPCQIEPASVVVMTRTRDEPRINGAAVRALREALGIGQAQMARDLGITASYLYRIEHGDRGCRSSLLRDIAARLAVAPSAIIRSSEDAA